MSKKDFLDKLSSIENLLELLLTNTPLNDIEWSHLNDLRKQLHFEINAIESNAYEVNDNEFYEI